jgi:phosphatidylserine decarboxylase
MISFVRLSSFTLARFFTMIRCVAQPRFLQLGAIFLFASTQFISCAPIPRHIDAFTVKGAVFDIEEGHPLDRVNLFMRAEGLPGAKKLKTSKDGSFLIIWEAHWKLYRSIFGDDDKDRRQILLTLERRGYEADEILDHFEHGENKNELDLGAIYLERKR